MSDELSAGVITRIPSSVASRSNAIKIAGMSNEKLSEYFKAEYLEELIDTLDTGDILLFRGLGPVSQVLRKLTWCAFSHVGMVVRNPSMAVRRAYDVPDSETEQVFCWEANMSTQPARPGGGTHMPTLRWKLERALVRESPEYLLCVRRLIPPEGVQKRNFPLLEQFMLEMKGVSYEMEKYEALRGLIPIRLTTSSENLNSVFCSELAAAAYKRMDLLKPSANPTNFLPRTFTSNQRLNGKDICLEGGWRLEREKRILSSKSVDQLIAERNPSYFPSEEAVPGDPIPAKLKLTVISGTDFAAMDKGGTSDPYIKIIYRDQKFKTKTIKKTLNADWNQEFYFNLTSDWRDVSINNCFIVFQIFDWNRVQSHAYMGSTFINLSQIELPQQYSLNLNTKGTLNVKLELIQE